MLFYYTDIWLFPESKTAIRDFYLASSPPAESFMVVRATGTSFKTWLLDNNKKNVPVVVKKRKKIIEACQ